MRSLQDDTGGAVTTWVIAMGIAALLLTALIVDTSRVLATQTAIADAADAAGRAAATTVNPITGRIDDPERARAEGRRIIAAAGMTGTIDPSSRSIEVTVSSTVDLPLLSSLGFGPRTVTTASSTIVKSNATSTRP